MKKITEIKGTINKIKFHSQELKNEISTLSAETISTQYYLGNLKRMSLQALDLFNAMEKQISILSNQKKLFIPREDFKRRERHEISMG
jgi:hypothetical protein